MEDRTGIPLQCRHSRVQELTVWERHSCALERRLCMWRQIFRGARQKLPQDLPGSAEPRPRPRVRRGHRDSGKLESAQGREAPKTGPCDKAVGKQRQDRLASTSYILRVSGKSPIALDRGMVSNIAAYPCALTMWLFDTRPGTTTVATSSVEPGSLFELKGEYSAGRIADALVSNIARSRIEPTR